MQRYKYLFGPVPSRRLGFSLGVDLVAYKTCSFDCVFCQLGRTTSSTVERKEYVPVDDVIEELKRWLGDNGVADYITLSGSGEPTLNTGFGDVIASVKAMTDIPVALLTNGTLLGDPDVAGSAAMADVVKVSLSAFDQESLSYVNRPHDSVLFDRLVEGIRYFSGNFKGRLWVEVFLLWGVNTIPDDVRKIADIVSTFHPEKVQLNTAVRPPAEDFAIAVPEEHMDKLAGLFDPPAEVIAEFSSERSADIKANEDLILNMIMRRPCTLDQVADAFGLHRNEVSKYVGKLQRTDRIKTLQTKGETYYSAEKDDMFQKKGE